MTWQGRAHSWCRWGRLGPRSVCRWACQAPRRFERRCDGEVPAAWPQYRGGARGRARAELAPHARVHPDSSAGMACRVQPRSIRLWAYALLWAQGLGSLQCSANRQRNENAPRPPNRAQMARLGGSAHERRLRFAERVQAHASFCGRSARAVQRVAAQHTFAAAQRSVRVQVYASFAAEVLAQVTYEYHRNHAHRPSHAGPPPVQLLRRMMRHVDDDLQLCLSKYKQRQGAPGRCR